MANDGQHIGGRYGIWGINPYGPTIKQTALIPNIMNTGIRTAEGVSKMFGTAAQSQQEQAKAKVAQGTADSEISSKNAMNQANEKYYPMQQMFKTKQEEQAVKEIMARTGVSYAQAAHLAAQTGLVNTQKQAMTDPTMLFDSVMAKLKAAPPGSPQRAMLTSFANNLLNQNGMQGGDTASTKGNKKTSVLGNMFPSKNATMIPGMQTNPLQGGSRSGYHQAATTDANGNPVTIESPTMASATRGQMRKEAEAESKYISPEILNGIKPYQGFGASIKLMNDIRTAKKNPGSPEGLAAAKRVQDYLTVSRLIPEMAAINARQATGQAPGEEVLRRFQDKQFPALPADFVANLAPADMQEKASASYVPLQQGLADQGINQERTGYQQEGSPDWASNNNSPNGRIDENGNFIPPTQNAPEQQEQQTAPVQMPSFNSKDEFRAWFNAQSPEEKARIAAQMKGGR